ncbi:hypothetical protein GCM10017600_29140 [Streptosporangium carneum]|uniref:Uncharacterized protein n=1 Tax=Streptosporangium carneum TaxID=47481 RepID=A0A9W6MD75_9ACTN|nr:hypothetical protein GCM10017600_29140 [Streptosporangium carneum]
MGDAVPGDALDDSGDAEAVVAVEMRHADPRDVMGTDARVEHLTLGALPGIEQEALTIPEQKISIVITVAGGDGA